jgi:drug/metabolite transporter (DMT)-like permease
MQDGTELSITGYVRAIGWLMVASGILGCIFMIVQRRLDKAVLMAPVAAVLAGYFLLRQTPKRDDI